MGKLETGMQRRIVNVIMCKSVTGMLFLRALKDIAMSDCLEKTSTNTISLEAP